MIYIIYSGKSLFCAPRVPALHNYLESIGESVVIGGVVKSNDLFSQGYDTSLVHEFKGESSPRKLFSFFSSYLFFLFRLFKAKRGDTIYAINPIAGVSALVVNKVKGVKFVYEAQELFLGVDHDFYRGRWRTLWAAIEKRVVKNASSIVTTDEFRSKFLRRLYKIEKKRCCYIYNLPPASVADVESKRGEIPGSPRVIFSYCGAVGPGRSVEKIIAAFNALDVQDAVLVIAGYFDPVFKKKLDNISRDNPRVVFTGKVSNQVLHSYMKASDFTFALYDQDSLNNRLNSPNKLFDSIVNGVTVITTSTFLSRKLFKGNDKGVLVNKNTENEIMEAMQHCLALEIKKTKVREDSYYTQEVSIPKLCDRVFR